MRHESRKYLFDMQQAARRIQEFTAGKTFEDYTSSALLRSGVERQFEIIGEALGKLVRCDAPTAQRIAEYRRIISFRNVLIHGYDAISDETAWDIVQQKLPILQSEVDVLLKEPE